jgi:predicted nucleotidyltransferase
MVEARPSLALAEHAAELRQLFSEVGLSNLRVFGSIARGEDTNASDIDLLADFAPSVSAFDVAAACWAAAGILGAPVDILATRALSPRMSYILDEAVPV